MTCVRTHSPALTVLSALVFSSLTQLLISLSHTKPPPAHPPPRFPPPSLALLLYFMMRDFGEETH